MLIFITDVRMEKLEVQESKPKKLLNSSSMSASGAYTGHLIAPGPSEMESSKPSKLPVSNDVRTASLVHSGQGFNTLRIASEPSVQLPRWVL